MTYCSCDDNYDYHYTTVHKCSLITVKTSNELKSKLGYGKTRVLREKKVKDQNREPTNFTDTAAILNCIVLNRILWDAQGANAYCGLWV